jgi:hypothetical protein
LYGDRGLNISALILIGFFLLGRRLIGRDQILSAGITGRAADLEKVQLTFHQLRATEKQHGSGVVDSKGKYTVW